MNKFLTKVVKIFLGLSMAAGVGVAIGASKSSAGQVNADAGDVLTTCVGTGSGYGTRRTATYNSVGWVLSTGQSGYLGANSAANHNKSLPTAADLPVIKAVNSSATTSTTGYYFYYTTTALSNVGSLHYTHTATNQTNILHGYVVYCDTAASSGSKTWELVTMANNSDYDNSDAVSLSGKGAIDATFTFNSTITTASYYGFIIAASSYNRITAGSISLIEGDTGESELTETTTIISTPSKTELDLAEQGDSVTLSATVEANSQTIVGATVSWGSSNTAVATIGASTGVVTPQGVGQAIMTATYAGDNSTYAGSSATITITVVDSDAETFELVTSNAGLLSGKEYVISDQTKTYFMAGQGSNNRSSVAGTVVNNSVTFISTMERVTISEVSTDTFELEATSLNAGYLYAAGASSSNHLKTEAAHDANNNSKFSISISSGVATIVAQGTATRNNLRFNSAIDQLKFSCYASTSDLPKVSLWKKSGIDKLATPTPVYNDGNRTITWNSVTGASSYQIKVDEGSWVTNVSSGYSVSSLTDGSHTVYLQAIGDGIDYSNSDVGNVTFTVTVPTTIESVAINGAPSSAVSSTLGTKITLTATATNSTGAGVSTFTWASSNQSVATIDSSTGELTYVGKGSTTITATSNYEAASGGSNVGIVSIEITSLKGLADLPLTVEEARTVATPATSASTTYYYYTEGIVSALADETYSSQYGNKTFWLTSDGEDDDTRELEIYRCKYLNNQSMTEEQFNSIEVGDTVVVYGQLRNYSSTLEYTQGCYLTSHIKPASTDPSVTITESDQSLDINDSPVTLHATLENCDGVTISWSSSDVNVATVTTPGATSTLTPAGGGTTTITASITVDGDTYTDTIQVTVVAPLLKAGDTIVFYNDTNYLVEMGTINGTAVGISGTTENALVFTVENGSSSGTFSFIADGLYIAWSSGNSLSTSSTKNSNSSWTLDGNTLTSVTIHNASDSTRKLQYNSGSPRFACYTSSQAAVSIEKRTPEADPTYVTLSSQTLTLEEEAEATLTITTDGRTSAFKWHSSNEQIVTVVGGVVTAGTTSGSTTVIVYFDSNKNGSYDVGDTPQQSCTVTVTAPTVDYNSISVGGTGTKITSSNSSTFLQDGKKIIFTYGDTYTYGPFASYLSTIANSQAFPLTFSNDTVTIGDGTSELSFMIIELEEATGGFYFKMKDGNYLGHGSSTTSAGNFTSGNTPTLWTISVDASGDATIHSGEEAVRSYVRVNTGSSNRLKPYAVGTGVMPNIYSFVEYTDEANTYASDFLSSGVCGNNDNTKASSSIWSQLRTSYLGMTDGAKYLMSHATANENSSQDIEKCAARYDRVIYLHYTAEPESYPDFMNRIANNYVTPKSTSNLLAIVGVQENTNTVAIIIIISMVSVTAIGGYFFLRKRKENI